jgi:hypothetical protein
VPPDAEAIDLDHFVRDDFTWPGHPGARRARQALEPGRIVSFRDYFDLATFEKGSGLRL